MFSRDGTDSNKPLGSCMSASIAGPLYGLLVDPCSVLGVMGAADPMGVLRCERIGSLLPSAALRSTSGNVCLNKAR